MEASARLVTHDPATEPFASEAGREHHAGSGCWISVAVSPFKYTEAYQYLKLEKKIAAGADCVITQLGYDMRKFRELKRYILPPHRNLRKTSS